MSTEQLIRRNDDKSGKSSSEDAVKSVRQGLKDIDGGKQPGDIEVLASAKFQKPGTLVMMVGASPTITLEGKSKDEVISQTVNYTARMQIMEAVFSNKDSTLCVSEVSFTSKVTPGAKLKVTYPLADYCQFGLEDTKNKCIQFETKDTLQVILSRFNDCDSKDSTDYEKIANCFCKAFTVKKSNSAPNSSASDGESSINATGSSDSPNASTKASNSVASSKTLTATTQTAGGLANTPNYMFLFLIMLCIYTFRIKH